MGESSVDVFNLNLFRSGQRTGEFSSRFLIGKHTSRGFLDNASALAFALASLYRMSNSKSDNFNFHF